MNLDEVVVEPELFRTLKIAWILKKPFEVEFQVPDFPIFKPNEFDYFRYLITEYKRTQLCDFISKIHVRMLISAFFKKYLEAIINNFNLIILNYHSLVLSMFVMAYGRDQLKENILGN